MDDDAVIRSLTEDMYAALSRDDQAWFQDHLLLEPETVHIGGGHRFWNTSEGLLEALGQQAEEVDIKWQTGEVVVRCRGDVAWVAARPMLRFDDGSELSCRATLVWVRQPDGEEWKLAHSHLSVPID
ncbi:MAG: SnoaL-like domain [Actinomycetota bacterium]|nr:SnoaL-like domain [Actinomycetota bacterium]